MCVLIMEINSCRGRKKINVFEAGAPIKSNKFKVSVENIFSLVKVVQT